MIVCVSDFRIISLPYIRGGRMERDRGAYFRRGKTRSAPALQLTFNMSDSEGEKREDADIRGHG